MNFLYNLYSLISSDSCDFLSLFLNFQWLIMPLGPLTITLTSALTTELGS